MRAGVALGLFGLTLLPLGCKKVTTVENTTKPVLVIVGHPPALPPVPEPPPPPPPPPPPKAVLEELGLRLDEPVQFGAKDAELTPDSYAVLDEVVAILRDAPWIEKLAIVVHTDTRGSKAANKRLATQRAKAVRDYLLEHGIESARIELEPRGESQPLLTDESEAAQAANRRVELPIRKQVRPPAGLGSTDAPEEPESTTTPHAGGEEP